MFCNESDKFWKLPIELDGEERERACCGVEGASDEQHFADVVA